MIFKSDFQLHTIVSPPKTNADIYIQVETHKKWREELFLKLHITTHSKLK